MARAIAESTKTRRSVLKSASSSWRGSWEPPRSTAAHSPPLGCASTRSAITPPFPILPNGVGPQRSTGSVTLQNQDMAAPRPTPTPVAHRHLALATVSFAVTFMAWGLVGAMAPRFRETLSLSGTATGLLIATPVLLGSLARLPMGLLADRF